MALKRQLDSNEASRPPQAPRLRPSAPPMDLGVLPRFELPATRLTFPCTLDCSHRGGTVKAPGAPLMRPVTAPFDVDETFELPPPMLDFVDAEERSDSAEDALDVEEEPMVFSFECLDDADKFDQQPFILTMLSNLDAGVPAYKGPPSSCVEGPKQVNRTFWSFDDDWGTSHKAFDTRWGRVSSLSTCCPSSPSPLDDSSPISFWLRKGTDLEDEQSPLQLR